MVGTYKYDGKEVSERDFKEKVYGSDSAQVKNYDKAQASEQNTPSKSKYSSGRDRSGDPIYWDERGQRKEGLAPDYVEPEKKAPIVIGVGKDDTGRTKVENVGQYLTEEQRREVSKLTTEKGRLTTESIKESQSVNDQGQTVSDRSVQFSYNDKQKSDVLVRPTSEKPPAYLMKEAQDRFRENPNAQKVTIGEWTFTRSGKTESKDVPEYIGSQGMTSKSDKPKGLINKIESKNDCLVSEMETRGIQGKTSFVQGASLFGLGVGRGVTSLAMIFVRPDKFAKGLWSIGKESLKDPLYLPRSLGTSFAQNPSGFVGEVVGGLVVGKVAGTVIKSGVTKFKAPKIVSESTGQTLRTEVAEGLNEGQSSSSTIIKSGSDSDSVIVRTNDVAGTVIKSGGTKFKAPKIVSESTGQTLGTEFAEGLIEGQSSSSTIIKSGSNKFKVDAKTQSVDRLDYADARLQSSKTDLTIQTLDKKGGVVKETTGFSRSETVASLTEDGVVLGRGDTVQATNVGKGSISRQGDFVSIGEGSAEGTRLTTIGSTSKGVKGAPVSSAKELNFLEGVDKKVSSIESSASKKILEFEAPVSKTVDSSVGKITISKGAPVKNTLFDDVSSSRGGSYLSKAEKTSKIKVDPYGQTTSQGGVSLSYKNFDDVSSPSPVNKAVASDKALVSPSSKGGSLKLTATDEGLVLSVKTNVISETPLVLPSGSGQALIAVEDVVSKSVSKANTIVEVSSKTVAPVAVGVSVVEAETAPLRPIQYSKVKGATPVLVNKSQAKSKPITATKTFSSTKVLTQQKNALEAVLDVRTKSKSKVALATATLQATDVLQATQQKTPLVQLTAQKVAIRQAVSTVQIIPSQLLISPIVNLSPKPVQKKSGGGFDVFVRTRGVFQKVSKSALGRSDARDFGAYNVANTPQATFTLRPSSSRVGTVSSKVKGSFFAFQSNFQKKGDLFIEKRGKRIKSGGEKAGITRLGILANKNKSIFKKVKL